MTRPTTSTTVLIQRCLSQLGGKGPAARAELLGHARRRLGLLAEKMLASYPRLHRREEAEDVFQEAMARLWKSLEEVKPESVTHFMRLAALQMRRALCDLARRHFGRQEGDPQSSGRQSVVSDPCGHTFENQPADSASRPEELACWSEFHAAADRLSEPERTAFDLLYYHGLPQVEAAAAMQVSERQVRRYWQSARRQLHRMLEGFLPQL
jgi:RNA polymerase sigma factor (sigma-70 family)